jgi:NAD(P)-dependent dehydrogenase (short-subunit alcohol dehydrogenase family)
MSRPLSILNIVPSAIVTGGESGVGRLIAFGLADLGWKVAAIDRHRLTAGGAEAAFRKAASDLGDPRLIVHAAPAERRIEPGPLADIGPESWDAGCEAVLREAIWCAMAARATLARSGGRLVFVLPVAQLAGVDGEVPYGAALEGLRGLAKSAARQWGSDGVTVNCLAIQTDNHEGSGASLSRWTPALGRTIDGRADVAPLISLLADEAAGVVTGATIVLDGGMVMVP